MYYSKARKISTKVICEMTQQIVVTTFLSHQQLSKVWLGVIVTMENWSLLGHLEFAQWAKNLL